MVLNWFRDSKHTGTAVGTLLTGDGVYSLAALYLCALILIGSGWRKGLMVEAAILLVILVVSMLFLKNPPTDNEPSDGHALEGIGAQLVHILQQVNILTATAYLVATWGLFSLFSSWMPTILIENAGWSEAAAGLLVSLLAASGIVTAFLFGRISDRSGRRKKPLLLAGLATSIAMGVLTLALAFNNYGVVVVMLPIVGMAVYAGVPLAIVVAAESVPSRLAGISNGVLLGGGFLLGGFAFPYMLGLVKDLTGSFAGGMLAATITCFILGFVVQLFARDSDPSAGPISTGQHDPDRATA